MKKIFLALIALIASISAFAFEYTAQCKINSTSYVVASQEAGSKTIKVSGYGQATNATVIVTVQSTGYHKSTYTVTIKNGSGEVEIDKNSTLVKVDNIVCESN